jgi:hypothetical protein
MTFQLVIEEIPVAQEKISFGLKTEQIFRTSSLCPRYNGNKLLLQTIAWRLFKIKLKGIFGIEVKTLILEINEIYIFNHLN